MESIIGNGGFQFKETIMSGDMLDEGGGTEKGIVTQVGHREG